MVFHPSASTAFRMLFHNDPDPLHRWRTNRVHSFLRIRCNARTDPGLNPLCVDRGSEVVQSMCRVRLKHHQPHPSTHYPALIESQHSLPAACRHTASPPAECRHPAFITHCMQEHGIHHPLHAGTRHSPPATCRHMAFITRCMQAHGIHHALHAGTRHHNPLHAGTRHS